MRILLKTPRGGGSASEMFVANNVPTFNAVLRNCMYRFMGRLTGSLNTIIVSLIDISQRYKVLILLLETMDPKLVCVLNMFVL